ncbi:tripartite motif-containing protein 35-like [Denticeps clupeoides]|uniref:RING-type E3 ubiquitin transferase n=1 Tax=Denticeps clupeoides TaxID=299321 RepID=A0AAY4BX46_9TELE|nr:tripartite motif-containing protein 35-like [Denticeps clupeoides]
MPLRPRAASQPGRSTGQLNPIFSLALRPRALSSHSRTAMEDELSCPVCCEIFSDPVVLKCSHSFCKTCLHQIWNKKATRRECPVCRRKCSLTEPPVSLALKNVCDALQKEQGGRTPVAAESSGCGAVGGKTEECCPAHGESVKLYCEDDAELLCCVCQTSRKHQGHSICPLEEAAQELKEGLRKDLVPLKQSLQQLYAAKQEFDDITVHIKNQKQDTERQIKDQFAELHQFLQKEEAARLALLQEEEEQKRQVTKKRTDCITLDILTLSHAIIAIENEIASNDMTFLQNFKNTAKRGHIKQTNPEKVPGALISVAKHVGSLKYRVWEKMQAIVEYTPVTLDPNTAYCWLSLSRDLTSVTNTGARQQLPDNPERFDHFVFVLGSEGFTEGRHAWEVEVGDKSDWVLGVVNETIERKSKITGCPKGGFWTISHSDGEYMAMTSPRTKLSLQGPLERVRVQLDCDLGQVSFSNPVDMTPIYTFSDHKFTETMFPFFCPGANINGNNSGPLKICPVKVAVWNSATW